MALILEGIATVLGFRGSYKPGAHRDFALMVLIGTALLLLLLDWRVSSLLGWRGYPVNGGVAAL